MHRKFVYQFFKGILIAASRISPIPRAPLPPLPPLPTYQCQVAIPRISLFDFSCSASGVEFNCWSIAAVLAAEAVQILKEDNGNIAFLFVTIDFDMIIDFVHNMLAVK